MLTQTTNFSAAIARSIVELQEMVKSNLLTIINLSPTRENFIRVSEAIGGLIDTPAFGPIRDLKVDTSTLNGSVGSSQNAHPPHTDGVYFQELVKRFMLQCVILGSSGGKGLFWDLRPMFDQMPREMITFFQQPIFTYSRMREDGITFDIYKGPLIFERDDGIAIRWRCDHKVRPTLIKNLELEDLFLESLAWINNFLQVNNPYIHQYRQGDIAICDNGMMLHGRSAIGSNYRYFRRGWIKY